MELTHNPPMDALQRVLLSVVVPAYNEEENLAEFYVRTARVLDSLPFKSEIIYVNDGSSDGSVGVVCELKRSDPRVALVDLSRNFGKEIAVSAGLDYAAGDAIIVIDADLQDPPELIPELVKYWLEGYDNVYAKRIARDGEPFIKKATARAFYWLVQKVSRLSIPENTGDFRLLSRRAVDSIRQFRETHRFMKGLFAWIGYPTKEVCYRRDPRFAGETKWNYWCLWNFAIEGITSFTIGPLKTATYLGLLAALGAFAYGTFLIAETLLHGNPVRGYPSLMVVILFIGGIQLMALGVIGEYLGRMFDETKQRPLYFVNRYLPSTEGTRRDVASNVPQHPILHELRQ